MNAASRAPCRAVPSFCGAVGSRILGADLHGAVAEPGSARENGANAAVSLHLSADERPGTPSSRAEPAPKCGHAWATRRTARCSSRRARAAHLPATHTRPSTEHALSRGGGRRRTTRRCRGEGHGAHRRAVPGTTAVGDGARCRPNQRECGRCRAIHRGIESATVMRVPVSAISPAAR